MPFNRSSTFTWVPIWMNIRDPPVFQAFWETGTAWSSLIVPCLMAAKLR